jgi:hypothetical protein
MSETEIISSLRKTDGGAWTWIRQNVLVIVGILSVIGSSTYFIITFYIRSSDSWQVIKSQGEEIKALKILLETSVKKIEDDKADKTVVEANQKSINDRLQRQYEGNNVRDARMTEIEKDAAYEKGLHQGESHRK